MRPLLFLIAILVLNSLLFAGGLSAGLIAWYAAHGESERAPVIICLIDRINAGTEIGVMARAGVPLNQVHERLLDQLKNRAATAQPPVRKSLEILETTAMARNIRTFWIGNMFAAELTRTGAELIANMAEVAEVGLDEDITLIPRVASQDATPLSNNVELNLRAVGATESWSRGWTGHGRLLCIMGEAFAKPNAALDGNRQTKFAPPNTALFDPLGLRTDQYCGDLSVRALSVMCGVDPALHDTLGVAPAAHWIGADLFVCGKSRFSTLLKSYEWAVDPDGNSQTMSDVPDAILNAWQLDAPCLGGLPALAATAFANVEALGPLLVFAANNSDNQLATMNGPAALEGFLAVGSVDARGMRPEHDPASAHGPSGCDGRVIKPELVAPGRDVRTASRDVPAGYARTSGSIIAAAHVAAAAALLREANPGLSVFDMKRALLLGATDAGTPGPDNSFGNGMLNIPGALDLATQNSNTGFLQGAVRYGGEPVEGARVRLSGSFGDVYATTNSGGAFRFDHIIADQPYTIRVGRFGFLNYEYPEPVTVPARGGIDLIVNMTRGFYDDVEEDQGWLLGDPEDNATGGEWTRALPVGSKANGAYVQPSYANSGKLCFVTANANAESAEPGSADVDGGSTSLRSPRFSLIELAEPELNFSYWYSNDKGPSRGDFFRVQISNDGGLKWVNLVNTASSTVGWKQTTIQLADFVVSTNNMVLRFVAEDAAPASLVEAAIDDITIIGAPTVPEPPRDLMIDVQFDQVVLAWRPSADAGSYKIYLSGTPDDIITPEHYLTGTTDTTVTIPMTSIPYDQFYFQVTAVR
ncbi:S8 family serine peptidase [candidate division KSB1 bacterium]|nr:S8 family serine peptidase [candidate division KSB1 bacterium]